MIINFNFIISEALVTFETIQYIFIDMLNTLILTKSNE